MKRGRNGEHGTHATRWRGDVMRRAARNRNPDRVISRELGKPRTLTLPDGRHLSFRVLEPQSAGQTNESTANRARTSESTIVPPAADLPTVVWVAGTGMPGLCWAPLHRVIGARHRSVIYDRAGVGRSSVDREEPTLHRMASDLIALIDHVGGPVVLVGRGWGGAIARIALSMRPDLVRSLMLLHPSDEHVFHWLRLMPPPWPGLVQRVKRMMMFRRMIRVADRHRGFTFSQAVKRRLRREIGSKRSARTRYREMRLFAAELTRIAVTDPSVCETPVTLISGTALPQFGAPRKLHRAMVLAHERTATANPAFRFIQSPTSAQFVHLADPALVQREVLRALQ